MATIKSPKMAITRQYGTKPSGIFTFSPANPRIDTSLLSANGEFKLTIIVNIKDANGLVLANQPIEFKINNTPHWLAWHSPAIGITGTNGNASIIVHGTIKSSFETNSYVNFALFSKNMPELNGLGVLSFTGMLPKS
jgi:hypothetical protein